MTKLDKKRTTPVTRAKDRVVGTLESTRLRIDDGFDEAEREVSRMARRVDRRYRSMRKRVHESRRQALRRVHDHQHRAVARIDAVCARARRQLQEHPAALPMAAGVAGFLTGFVFGARASCSDLGDTP